MGLAKVAVQCFVEIFVQGSIFALRTNISAKNRHLRKAGKR